MNIILSYLFQSCTWMTVVEEPAEGELVESVVVAVDVLVALRPATINNSVEISKMTGPENLKYFSIQQNF